MKRAAEQEVRVLIAKMRAVCQETGDCPIGKARQPAQLDCVSCILKDMEAITAERNALRKVMAQVTEYGTTCTKLEAAMDPTIVPELKKQLRGQ